jgi:hypothetical protein
LTRETERKRIWAKKEYGEVGKIYFEEKERNGGR